MTALAPLDIPATTAGTPTGAAPVYRSLMVQPQHWLRQAFFVGRPKLPVARVGVTFLDFFQLDKEGRPKGIVALDVQEFS